MNNQCPTCGAVYHVAEKDIGRRIRCKKCSTGLVVAETGLELDDPAAAGAARPDRPERGDRGDRPDDEGGERRERRERRDRKERSLPKVDIDFLKVFRDFGGVPTVLFGVGLFLVVYAGFQDAIGAAKVIRKQANYEEVQTEHKRELDAIDANKDLKESDKAERTEKENKRWLAEEKVYDADRKAAAVGASKSKYFDKYILMFGFLLIAFGCVGYLQAGSPLLLRIVAAVILVSMVLAMFKAATGTGAGIGVTAGLG